MATTPLAAGLSFGQIYAILRAHTLLVLGVMVATLAGTFALTQFLPKSYTAVAELFVDFKSNDPIGGRSFNPMQDEAYLQTQVDMIKSEEVALRAMDMSRFRARGGKVGFSDGDTKARAQLLEQFGKDLEVGVRKTSRVIEMKFSADSPSVARDVLNAAIQSYMDMVRRMASEPAKARQEQYNKQLDALRKELDSLQSQITAYQQEHGIVDVDERSDTESRQLADLTTRMTALQSQQLETNARRRAIENMVKSGVPAADIPEVAVLRGLPELRLKLADAERQLAEAGSVYGRNHPKFKVVQAERDVLLDRMNREARVALNTLMTDERRFDKQAQAVAAEIQERQRRVLDLKKHRDVLLSYQRQMESVRQIYTAAAQKYDDLLIASNMGGPNIAVLRWATAPYTHSKPRLQANMIASVPVGLILGLGLAFLLELANRRVRHVDDLERDLGLEVLGRVAEKMA